MKDIKNTYPINYIDLFKNLPGLYIILSRDFVIADISESLAESSMTRREDIIGKNLFVVFPDNPNNKKADGEINLRQSLAFVLQNKIAHSMPVQRYDIQKPDGEFEIRYWSPVNKPLLDSKNEVAFIIHRVEDVTDYVRLKKENSKNELFSSELESKVKKMEIEIIKRSKEIQHMNILLEEKVKERTRHLEDANATIQKNFSLLSVQKKQLEDFSNIISHNLRAPLVNISMLTEMITQTSNEEEKQFLTTKLHTAAHNLNQIFEELVESIQISEDPDIPCECLSFQNYIDTAINGLQGEINKSNAQFEINITQSPSINYPPIYLNSILHNLISNSLKYQHPKRSPFIKITTQKKGKSIVLSVEDNGLGIDLEKHKDNLFKIRKVFHNHVNAKGFGLFITKSQVVAMQGRIWAESIPEEGSTFFVEFNNQ